MSRGMSKFMGSPCSPSGANLTSGGPRFLGPNPNRPGRCTPVHEAKDGPPDPGPGPVRRARVSGARRHRPFAGAHRELLVPPGDPGGAGRHHGGLGERRRGDPRAVRTRPELPLAGNRQQGDLRAPLHHTRHLRVPLLAPSTDEGNDRRPLAGREEDTMFESNRREFMQCMAWAGAGVVWTLTSGGLASRSLAQALRSAAPSEGLHFVQISDTHIGFDKDANPDTTATARAAIARINALAD